MINFAILYHNCTVGQFLQRLTDGLSIQNPVRPPAQNKPLADRKIRVVEDSALRSYALLKYLGQRQIPIEIANRFCREVRYTLDDKTYFGIGFKNDSNAWEIRNPYFKSGSSPKDITTFNTGADEIFIFEGFMDFLSFQTMHKDIPSNSQDFVVLNSVSFFEKARPFMEKHHSIHLYLDQDQAGMTCTRRALSLSTKYKDESKLYQHNKDLNEWLIRSRKAPKKRLGRGIS